jgi:hypothetical protein
MVDLSDACAGTAETNSGGHLVIRDKYGQRTGNTDVSKWSAA